MISRRDIELKLGELKYDIDRRALTITTDAISERLQKIEELLTQRCDCCEREQVRYSMYSHPAREFKKIAREPFRCKTCTKNTKRGNK